MIGLGVAILACFTCLFVVMDASPFGFNAVSQNNTRENVTIRDSILVTSASNTSRGKANSSDLDIERLKKMLRKEVNSGIKYDGRTSRFMIDLYNNLRRGQNMSSASGHVTGSLDALKPDTIRSFSPRGVSISYTRSVAFDYKVPRLPRDEHVRLAEFRLKRTRNKHNLGGRVKIFIKRGHVRVKKIVVKVKPTTNKDYTYDIYDITSAISPWVNGLHGNVTLRIVVRSRLKIPELSERDELIRRLLGAEDYGLLVFYSKDTEFMHKIYTSYSRRTTRRRHVRETASESRTPAALFRLVDDSSGNPIFSRNVIRKKRESNRGGRKSRRRKHRKSRKPCRRVNMTVDFDIIGWGRWIVYPKKYNAYACKGTCKAPIDSRLKPTNHAMLQSLLRQKRGRVVNMPCCAPIEHTPLTMMYFEYGEIVVRHNDDMIVKQCACR